MHLSSRVYRKLRLLAVGTLVLSAVAAGPALAKGPRNRNPGTGNERCSVIPNPVSNDVAGNYTVVGSGFLPYLTVEIDVVGYGTQVFYGTADAYGNFASSSAASLLQMDGLWTVRITNGGSGIYATCYLQVS